MAFGGNDSGRGYGNSEHEGPTRDGSVADSGDNGYGPNHEGSSSRRGGDGASDRNGSNSRSTAASSASSAFGGGKTFDPSKGQSNLSGSGQLWQGASDDRGAYSPVKRVADVPGAGTFTPTDETRSSVADPENFGKVDIYQGGWRRQAEEEVEDHFLGAVGGIVGGTIGTAVSPGAGTLVGATAGSGYAKSLNDYDGENAAFKAGMEHAKAIADGSLMNEAAKGAKAVNAITNQPYSGPISLLQLGARQKAMHDANPSAFPAASGVTQGGERGHNNGGSKGLLNYMQSKSTRPQQSTFAAPELPNLWDLTVTRGY